MPLAVSQSQISVPSMVSARAWNPPPGKTTIAAPLLLPLGGNTVMVGALTSNTAWDVGPAIASGVCAVRTLSGGCAIPAMFGAPCGQIAIGARPAGGGQMPGLRTLAGAGPEIACAFAGAGSAWLLRVATRPRQNRPSAQARINQLRRTICSPPRHAVRRPSMGAAERGQSIFDPG